VGVNENVKMENESFVVYPNPANERLYIRSNFNSTEKISFTIMDISGRTLAENILDTSGSVDLAGFSSGVYFIRLIRGETVSTQKFIISR
jgi:hypothetical protein